MSVHYNMSDGTREVLIKRTGSPYVQFYRDPRWWVRLLHNWFSRGCQEYGESRHCKFCGSPMC